MKIITIPVLSDNYAYLVIDEATNEAGVVDPSEAGPVAEAVKREGVNFTTIINTHHHWDHVGGNKELVQEYPDLRVYGHKRDETRTPCISHMVDEGDTVSIGNLEGRFLFIPCHTSGACGRPFCGRKSGLYRRHAVCRRLRAAVRGHGRRHAQQHAQAERPARGHPHLPRP